MDAFRMNVLDMVQLLACISICYACFCRLVKTDSDTSAPLRHAISFKLGAFMMLGLSPWTWAVSATLPSTVASLSVAIFLMATARFWPSVLTVIQHHAHLD